LLLTIKFFTKGGNFFCATDIDRFSLNDSMQLELAQSVKKSMRHKGEAVSEKTILKFSDWKKVFEIDVRYSSCRTNRIIVLALGRRHLIPHQSVIDLFIKNGNENT
jgi:hypothetical protein